jgi:choline dehydrogenase
MSTASILVIEYGPLDNQAPSVLVPGLFPGMTELASSPYLQFNLTSTPQASLNNRTYEIPVASAVGGGTVINGVFFDRAAAADYNTWASLVP